MTLLYYRQEIVDDYFDRVEENLDWYYDPAGKAPEPKETWTTKSAPLDAQDLAALLKPCDTRAPETDGANALLVYGALRELSPHQATDERLWAYFCHNACSEYVAWRWLARRPDDAEAAARKVRNHFFARRNGSRSLVRDNGVARLWWLGHIAHQVGSDSPASFLEILLHRQDVRSALIERPAVSMNLEVLKAIYGVMLEHWQGETKNLFRREAFRTWMVNVNRRGGVVLLDALPSNALAALLLSPWIHHSNDGHPPPCTKETIGADNQLFTL